jgi:predicted NBD/HSP70 family sugar kinase
MSYKDSNRNILKVINTIRTKEKISRAEISRLTGLSKPAVSLIVKKLLSNNVIIEIGKFKNEKIGKNPTLLAFNPLYKMVLALDIGGTNFRTALLDLNGNLIQKKILSSKDIKSKKDFLSLIEKSIRDTLEKSRIEIDDLAGVSIGIPGTVDSKGIIRYMPAFDISDLDLRSNLEETFNIKRLIIENDVTLQTVGEMWQGAAKGFKNVFCVSIGTGIGGGFVINGEIYSGSHGMAGEIGYSVTDYSIDKERKIKDFGALELWASGNTLEKISKDLGISVKDLFEKYKNGDEKVKDIVDSALEHIGAAIANVISLMDPEAIIFAGGIGVNQFETILNPILRVVKKFVPKEIVSKINFRKAVLGDDGVLIGGCYEVQRNFLLKNSKELNVKV